MLKVPLDRLPEADHERHAALRDYFCDKDATAVRRTNNWELTMFWPTGADRHVDPLLPEGLKWWGAGVGPGSMALASRRQGRVLTCLYDTLTLQSWCEWWVRHGGDQNCPIMILHIDDHRDLGSPRLASDGIRSRDLITGKPVSVSDPSSVADAIESGAIGMGSFLTPFLHAFPRAEVRHLCQPPKAKATCDFRIERVFEKDTVIDPSKDRPAIRLQSLSGTLGPGTYRLTPHVEEWIENLPETPTLLHIDMDYFNNRYDGDSGWREREETLDPDFSDITRRIKGIGQVLRKNGILSRIEDAVVAYSPGFFPAEFWRKADVLLRENLADLYAD